MSKPGRPKISTPMSKQPISFRANQWGPLYDIADAEHEGNISRTVRALVDEALAARSAAGVRHRERRTGAA